MKPTQPAPDVDMQDVERIVRRDYPADLADTILKDIAAVEVREKARVVLGCLKREAEYPLATKRWSRIESLTDEERASIYDKDWRQYSEWLHRT